MKIRQHLSFLAIALAVSGIALPISAEAHMYGKHHYKKSCCKYYHSTCKWKMHKVCQVKPSHWWGTTWIPASQECWWVK